MGTPYPCPICKGKKKVRKGFYPDRPDVTACETCWGQGIVWDNTASSFYYIPPTLPPPMPNYWGGGSLIQCGNCKKWHTPGDGHSCTVSGTGFTQYQGL